MPVAKRPSRVATLLELRAPFDWATLLLRAPFLLTAPRGDGRPVMLLPGFGTDERAMRPLGRYLRFLGYDVYDWGIGRNMGRVEEYIDRVGERVQEIHDELGGVPLTLIGWSLGGVIAREAARDSETNVREVITLGTPVIGGPKYTAGAERFASGTNMSLDEIEVFAHERNLLGLRQPVTSIYSKADGVVGWRASIDVYNAHARNIEVFSSHFGIGAHGRVWQLIAGTLGNSHQTCSSSS